MGREGFRGLKVWQKAKDLAVFICKVTNREGFSKDRNLREQMRKAAISIPSNIAEGDELGSDKQASRFFNIAKGSAAELLTQAIIAQEIDLIDKTVYDEIDARCTEILKMLSRLISIRSNS
ncbi:MAG: four helix bundle protein [Syntrophaceae bacterium]|nr:four helix bundle protein [Syntrophaceae bacterium]NLX32191.1 four helix bundle protein [Deltaproteobacteria bacterium]HOF74705.1 four helix bundle protein [Syntrophales bacterium]HOT49207.1 four helix bundle protein [Syntrophales bacterium]HPG71578.1 four helix bundle protein [Syntrophales bacterium]